MATGDADVGRPDDEQVDGAPDDEDLDEGGLDDDVDEDIRPRRAPWHFKVLLAGTVVYLGWRAYQGVEWLIHHV